MDFYDVKSKDFIELAGVPEHLQGTVIATHRVKWRLREILEAHAIAEPYDQLFYTTWGKDGVVNYSESLVDLLTRAVLDSERPSIGPHGGLFRVRSQTSQHLYARADINLVSEALGVVYDHIKETEQAG
ncbi:hypothetical protein G7007_02920 [Pseudomonas entomophila]|jgi:hypothetical protein|uniref:hypothetical protein n=1 Tax=Pseudomonas entomophila TaxID=312306 RepID=UPI0015E3F543|nr:hypothetical protein [Pseudomonas entomophila]MBA1191816.1 hypothetical protein [Pseudomonas entomophila]